MDFSSRTGVRPVGPCDTTPCLEEFVEEDEEDIMPARKRGRTQVDSDDDEEEEDAGESSKRDEERERR